MSNEDSSSIIVKRFRQGKIFPVISLCLRSKHAYDGLYNGNYTKDTLGMDSHDYKDVLLGKRLVANITGIIDAEFNEATNKLQKYLKKFRVQDTNENEFVWRFNETTHELGDALPTIYRSELSDLEENIPKIKSIRLKYQDPTLFCYEYMTDLLSRVTIDSIDFYLDISKLREIRKDDLYIYANQPNQLIRNLRYIYKIRRFSGVSKDSRTNVIIIDLNSISVIQNRADANEPCDANLEDDDAEWMRHVVETVGCVPPYWRKIYQGPESAQCTTTEQLKNLSFYLPMKNELGTMAIFQKYIQPCTHMRVQSNANSDQYKREDTLKLKIRLRYDISCHNFIIFPK